MSQFLKRFLLFILVLIVTDQIIGFCLRQLYFSQHKGQFAQTTYAIDSANQDILIFGSSRAVRHYSTSILSNTYGKSCYNVGRDGQQIPYYVAVQDVIFGRKKPSMVILDINTWEFSINPSRYEKLSILLPYCHKHPELVKYVELDNPFERYKLLSAIYPYNSSLFIAANNKIFENKIPSDDKGYDPIIRKMNQAGITYTKKIIAQAKIDNEKKQPKIDSLSYSLYRQFLQKCVDAHIATYVVISPTIVPETPNERKDKLLSITKEFPAVTFLDFSSSPNYNDHFEKFADIFHLNKEGSEEFTKELLVKIGKLPQ